MRSTTCFGITSEDLVTSGTSSHFRHFRHFVMYLHIGLYTYLRTSRIIAILPRSILQQPASAQPFLEQVKIVVLDVPAEEAKACILTDTNELYFSVVNYRTLRQRWKAQKI
jgi:hypothetical protein